MCKTAIIYGSRHHGNTRKLVTAIAERFGCILIDADHLHNADLTEYELIGFASGIDFGKFYDSVESFLRSNLPDGKKVFFLYTCAKVSKRFTDFIRAEANSKNAFILGEFGCRGFNTYGPWKLIGGMNRNHSSEEEIHQAIQFVESLLVQKDT